MEIKFLVTLFLSVIVTTTVCRAASVKAVTFTPVAHVFDCPKGFKYEVMECVDSETKFPRQRVELQDIEDGFFIGEWNGAGNGVQKSTNQLSFSLHPDADGVVVLMMNLSSGFQADPELNRSVFFEAAPATFPKWMLLTGDRRPNGLREIEAAIEYTDLKVEL